MSQIAAGGFALAALQRGGTGAVLSVHQRAVNLGLGDEEIVGLLAPALPLHPWAVSTPLPTAGLTPGTPVRVREAFLEVGPLRLDLRRAHAVDLRLSSRPLQLAGSTARWLAIAARAALQQEPGHPAFAAELEQVMGELCRHGDVNRLQRLLGVGEGLTPAGDDVLVGVLAGLDLLRELGPAVAEARTALAGVLLPRLRHDTSRLAACLIEAAIDGAYAEPLVALLRCLGRVEPRPVELRTALQRLIALGHSSGREMLRGLAGVTTSVLGGRGQVGAAGPA